MRKLLPALILAACAHAAPARPTLPAFVPASFRVEVAGPADGRPVIFIPGLACSGHVWDGTVAHLAGGAAGKVRTHVITIAGFAGTSPEQPPPAALLDTVRGELAKYIRAQGLDHPVVVGHSLGGFLTYWLAESEPELLGGAVVVDSVPFFAALQDGAATTESIEPQARALRDQIAAQDPGTFKVGLEQFLGQMVKNEDARAKMLAEASKSDPRTTAEAIYELFRTDLRPDLGKISVPVTIIAAGEGPAGRDVMEKAWHSQIDAIPTKTLAFVEQARHFVMLDQPERFYALVDQALKR
jgi:pimeloyl-ACP methyl ester carboxylesterase